MEKPQNFIIFGPGGRTGSHWVESIIIDIYNSKMSLDSIQPNVVFRSGDLSLFPTFWIYHTNQFDAVREISVEIKNSTTLVYCCRKNYFESTISLLVAQRTGEYFEYTNKAIEPFVVDIQEFKMQIYYRKHYLPALMARILPSYPRVVNIEFDDFISAKFPYQYVSDQLGIDYIENVPNHYRDFLDQSKKNQNKRSYKELILNWEELVEIYKVFSAEHHTQ